MELSRRSAQFCWRHGSGAATAADSSSMRTEDAIRCYSPSVTALESGTSTTVARIHRDRNIQLSPYPFRRAYTSTSRLSLGLAPAVNDIVSFGDEFVPDKVTTKRLLGPT